MKNCQGDFFFGAFCACYIETQLESSKATLGLCMKNSGSSYRNEQRDDGGGNTAIL